MSSVTWQLQPLILGSASASRQEMLRGAGIEFTVAPAAIDEGAIKTAMVSAGQDARAIALALARAKAELISTQNPGSWVLGSDSMVSVERQLFDKPVSREDAARHLRAFSGQLMTLDSAAVLARDGTMIDYASDDAHLEVRVLSDAFIATYLDAEWPAISACVGCFRIEARGVHLFQVLTGSQFTILGMPLLPVLDRLRNHGIIAG